MILVYAPTVRGDRERVWIEIIEARAKTDYSVMIFEDFKEVLRPEEHRSRQVSPRGMTEFGSFLNILGVAVIPLKGRKYTWSRGKFYCRIDRVFMESGWFSALPDLQLLGLRCNYRTIVPS